MRIKLELKCTAYQLTQLPGFTGPQIGLTGRSNVGKSSLINALCGSKKMAKTSATPGKTRSINFYWAAREQFYLVDLPGYGYARRSKSERKLWGNLVNAYLSGNTWLKAMVILLDSRLPPQKTDLELITYFQHAQLPILPALTKADKCNQSQKAKAQKDWQHILSLDTPPLLLSSKTKSGLKTFWAHILTLIQTKQIS